MKKTLRLHLELVRFVKNVVTQAKNGDVAGFKNLYMQKLDSEISENSSDLENDDNYIYRRLRLRKYFRQIYMIMKVNRGVKRRKMEINGSEKVEKKCKIV